MKKRSFHRRVKDYVLPHKGNRHKPHLFRRQAIAAIALTLFLIEGAYLLQTEVILKIPGFNAAVLPGALAALTNADRQANQVGTLIEDPLLARAAQEKADDMATRGYFAHVSPDGQTFRANLDNVGYEYTYAGENLAVDFNESIDVATAWMNSATHRANILKKEYTHMGYGVASGIYQGKQVTFVVQFFAAKRASPASPAAPAAVAAAPARAPADKPMVIQNAAPSERVLGAEIAIPKDGRIAVLATSPSRAVWYMLVAFTALVAFLFVVTLVSHARNKYLYMEVIVGGLLILAIGIGLIVYNESGKEMPEVPVDSQNAAVPLSS